MSGLIIAMQKLLPASTRSSDKKQTPGWLDWISVEKMMLFFPEPHVFRNVLSGEVAGEVITNSVYYFVDMLFLK